MMSQDDWYRKVGHSIPLEQGDIIQRCRVLLWDEIDGSESPDELLKLNTQVDEVDVIVMSQSCDLLHDKIDTVLLCEILELQEFRLLFEKQRAWNWQDQSSKAWNTYCEDIRDGYVWHHCLLKDTKIKGLESGYRIVDFKKLYTLPLATLRAFLSKKNGSRLRLKSPYCEHLSQAFARYFMRVGLPQVLDKKEIEKATTPSTPAEYSDFPKKPRL